MFLVHTHNAWKQKAVWHSIPTVYESSSGNKTRPSSMPTGSDFKLRKFKEHTDWSTFRKTNINVLEVSRIEKKRQLCQAWIVFSASTETINENVPIFQKLLTKEKREIHVREIKWLVVGLANSFISNNFMIYNGLTWCRLICFFFSRLESLKKVDCIDIKRTS